MIDLELWPWGVAIMVLLSMLIGWFAREIYRRKELDKKDEIIHSQEREYVRLADQHVQNSQIQKTQISDLEEKLEALRFHNESLAKTVEIEKPSEEDAQLILDLRNKIDLLEIEKQKLTTVPQAMYIEKNAALKKEIKKLHKQKGAGNDQEEIKELRRQLKKYKKKLKRRKKPKEKRVEIRETIDFKKLKKILKNLPTKRTTVVMDPNKSKKS